MWKPPSETLPGDTLSAEWSEAYDQSDCRNIQIPDDTADGSLYLCEFPLLFLPGYGTQAQGMCQTEPGHVRHTFSGIPGHVPEDRGRGDAGHASGILRGAGGLFPVLYLPVPPVVPECVQTAGKQRLYAVMRGLYHAHPAVHGKGPGQGPAPVCHCGHIRGPGLAGALYHGAGMAALQASVGICGGRAPDSSGGMGCRKRELRRPVVPYHSRSIHPAVGICEADLCVFCGVHVLSVHGFQNHFPDNGRGRRSCSGSGAVQGSGKRPDFLCHLPADAVCCHRKLGVSDNGKRPGNRSCPGSLPAV